MDQRTEYVFQLKHISTNIFKPSANITHKKKWCNQFGQAFWNHRLVLKKVKSYMESNWKVQQGVVQFSGKS